MLFFRTSGLLIPPSFSSDSSSSSNPSSPEEQQLDTPTPSRKAHLKFPPAHSGLRIPTTRIAVTSAWKEKDVLREQAEEFVKLMRRSVALHEAKERRGRFGDGVENGNWGDYGEFDGVVEAERRISLVELEGRRKEDDGEWAAEFFEDVVVE
jgi:hypothetical protein